MKTSRPSKLITAIYLAGSSILGTCLNFLAKAEWRIFFEKVALIGPLTLAAILLPLVLLIDYAKVGLAAWKIHKDKEATPSNISHLLIEVIKASLATPAILGIIGVIALPALVGPVLFITAVAIGAAYNIALTGMHAWQWLNANSRQEAQQHKLLALKYGSAALVGTLLAVGVGLVLLGGFGAVALLAIGITTASIVLVGGVVSAIIGYKVDRALSEQSSSEPSLNQFAEVLRPLINTKPSPGHKAKPADEIELKPGKLVKKFEKTANKVANSIEHGINKSINQLKK